MYSSNSERGQLYRHLGVRPARHRGVCQHNIGNSLEDNKRIKNYAVLPYLSFYYIKLKSRLSVRLSVRIFWHADISVVSASIETGLARNESCVIEED